MDRPSGQAGVYPEGKRIRELAAAGEEAFARLLREGIPDALDQAIDELASFPR